MKTTIKTYLMSDLDVLNLEILNPVTIGYVQTPEVIHINIHNMPLDSIVAFRDSLDKAIEEETTRQLNEMGSIPNISEPREKLKI
jgi:hypothetical protein